MVSWRKSGESSEQSGGAAQLLAIDASAELQRHDELRSFLRADTERGRVEARVLAARAGRAGATEARGAGAARR